MEDVFNYASDWQKWKDWFVGISNVRTTTEKKRGNGTRYAYEAKMMVFSVTIETEIDDFVVNQGWKGKATKGMPHQTHWVFESIQSGTNFTYTLEYSFPLPILGSFLDRLILKPYWNKIIETSLKNIQQKFQ